VAELEILSAPPGTTIQDAGRLGWLSQSLPPSGPLDREAHAAANVAVGNAPGAAAIELPLGALEVRALASLEVSIDGELTGALEPGESLRIEACSRAVRYLAVAGGIDVPVVLGARATMLVANLGGLEGRALRAGDRLAIGTLTGGRGPASTLPEPPEPASIPLLPGPHLSRLPPRTFEHLLATGWTVSRLGDRVGVRLEGGKLAREGADLGGPVPMIRGAVQLATDGTPIVLGPEHPITGGYPVAAVVTTAGQDLLARLRPGRRLRFVVA
jgi:biotin-dependent carboxylase-like uncharacterized protein